MISCMRTSLILAYNRFGKIISKRKISTHSTMEKSRQTQYQVESKTEKKHFIAINISKGCIHDKTKIAKKR